MAFKDLKTLLDNMSKQPIQEQELLKQGMTDFKKLLNSTSKQQEAQNKGQTI